MGSIGSRHGEIRGIDIRPWPTKPVSGIKAVRIDDRTIVGVGERGTVYCTQFHHKVHYSFPWKGSQSVLWALAEMGRIPKEVYAQHVRELEEATRRDDRAWAAERVLSNADEAAAAGFKLTAAQRRELLKIVKASPRVWHSYQTDLVNKRERTKREREAKRAAKAATQQVPEPATTAQS